MVVPVAPVRLVADLHRPRLVVAGLPADVPTDGRAVVEFDAGFGPAWGDVPADLQQAVLLLAAEFYEHRHDDGTAAAGLPFGRGDADRALAAGADPGWRGPQMKAPHLNRALELEAADAGAGRGGGFSTLWVPQGVLVGRGGRRDRGAIRRGRS